jgi:hypothetical protein
VRFTLDNPISFEDALAELHQRLPNRCACA